MRVALWVCLSFSWQYTLNCSYSAMTKSTAIKYDRVNDKSLKLEVQDTLKTQTRQNKCRSNKTTMNTKFNYLQFNVLSLF